MSQDATAFGPGHGGPRPSVGLLAQEFTAEGVTALRHRLEAEAAAIGLTGDAGFDFVLAVHELVTNAVRHGGGRGRLDLRREDDVLICEITDEGSAAGNLSLRLPAGDVAGGRGLWLAHQLTEGLIITRRPHGVSATVSICLRPPATPAALAVSRDDEISGPAEESRGDS